MRTPQAEACLTVLTRMRALLEIDGMNPWAITWGPWWEDEYYAV